MPSVNYAAACADVTRFVSEHSHLPLHDHILRRRLLAAELTPLRTVSAEMGYSTVHVRKVEAQLREELVSRTDFPDLHAAVASLSVTIDTPVRVTDLPEGLHQVLDGTEITLLDLVVRLNDEHDVIDVRDSRWLVHECDRPDQLRRRILAAADEGVTYLSDLFPPGVTASADFPDYVADTGWYFLGDEREAVISSLNPVSHVITALLRWHGEMDTADLVSETIRARAAISRTASDQRIRILLRDSPDYIKVSKNVWALASSGLDEHVDGVTTMTQYVRAAGAEGVTLEELEKLFTQLGYSPLTVSVYASRPDFVRVNGRVMLREHAPARHS